MVIRTLLRCVMQRFIFNACAESNIGRIRQSNEDNYFVCGNTVNAAHTAEAQLIPSVEGVVAVCDGMGGLDNGELASQLAAETLNAYSQTMIKSRFSTSSILSYFDAANEKICGEIRLGSNKMGCAFAMLGFRGRSVVAANIGDSRVYSFLNGSLTQLSKDHTEAQALLDAGVITRSDEARMPSRHLLTQYLGVLPEDMKIEPYIVKKKAKEGERFLLCSDGLYEMLSDGVIEEILRQNLTLKDTTRALIDSALNAGGKDNVTVILCEINRKAK